MTRVGRTLEQYTPRRRDEVLELMALVQGHPTAVDDFVWEFERNPAGGPNIHLALVDGAVVALACHNVFRMRVAGKQELVSFPLNVLTHPEFRGGGLFSALELACEERAAEIGVRVMLSFPNALSEPIFLSKLGWQSIPGPRIVARPLRAGKLAAAWRPALARPGAILDPLLRGGRSSRADFRLRRVDRFGQWADDLDAENANEMGSCVIRSADYLNWRFLDRPGGVYDAYIVDAGGDAVGHVVVGSTKKRGVPFTYLANAMVRPSWWGRYANIRRAATRAGQGWSTAAAALDLHGGVAGPPSVVRGGYVPTPKRLRFIGKGISAVPTTDWFFQLGDLDFF